MSLFHLPSVTAVITAALAEDLGRGDITTAVTVPAGTRATATLLAKQDGVLAGLPLVARVFAVLGADEVALSARAADGDRFTAGTVLATLTGPAADLLIGERTALNFVQQLSGVATLTRQFVDAVAGTHARVVDTRKTTPGLRVLEKYAVRMGGGHNHRLGLDDGVLIKDNHITAAGGIAKAVSAARLATPHLLKVQVECATRADIDEALAAGADVLLLDNMSVDQLAEAVQLVAGRVPIEASGGVTLATIRAVAATGVDLISVGALTHSAPAIDLSMKIQI